MRVWQRESGGGYLNRAGPVTDVMYSRLLAAVAAGLTAAILLTGCSSSDAGSGAEPTAGTGSGNSQSEPTFSDSGGDGSSAGHSAHAPTVSQPLDATRFLGNPCAALDKSQLSSFGITGAGRPDTTSGVAEASGPGCTWSNEQDYSAIAVGFITGNKHGLDDLYQAKVMQPPGYFGYFEPTTVDGYPAVFNDGTDGRSTGRCALAVGVNETMTLFTQQQGGDGPKSCSVAKQVAAAVITTLKGDA